MLFCLECLFGYVCLPVCLLVFVLFCLNMFVCLLVFCAALFEYVCLPVCLLVLLLLCLDMFAHMFFGFFVQKYFTLFVCLFCMFVCFAIFLSACLFPDLFACLLVEWSRVGQGQACRCESKGFRV